MDARGGGTGVTVMASLAWAQGATGGGGAGGTLLSLVPLVLILVIFYFLLILPQQKRQKKLRTMLEALKKGDKVVTSSGIWGTITNMGKDTVTIQIADNTKVKIQRDHIARLRTDDED
ncbi:MAG: preprotein translocase subunit YajC [Nitrospirae bacterium]|nr:preprotein translocase subunit YajC [Nitrospirota bacterium]